MKLFSTLLLLFIASNFYGQDYYFINAENGLNVRSASNLTSEKIAKIRFGAIVEKIAETNNTLTVNDNGKQITGKFVKIKYRKTYLIDEDVEGYVFDGYLRKQVNDDAIQITEVDEATYKQLLKLVSKANYNPKKITELDAIKTILTTEVDWFAEGAIESIQLTNGQKLLFDKNAVDFGFSEGSSGYYPEEGILALEGGHSIDVCISVKTGETELTIGNPKYIIPSPKNTYRLNGYFGGHECVLYFFQKKENGKFTYLTGLNFDYDICTFKEFHWINNDEFIYVKMNNMSAKENGTVEYYKGKINQIKPKFSSKMRPNKPFVLNEVYTDTIEFSTYNDDGDYFHLTGKKNGNIISLIYNWDWNSNEKYNFKYGDIIKVKWKMDRIIYAGDEEVLDFSERAIDAERLISKNKQVKFLWRAEKFDEELNQTFNSIFINEPFCYSISNQEKAALGYVATFIGNECSWDDKANENRSNLKCEILTALNLGYQCSDQHLGFLRSWFSTDSIALKELAICRTMPNTATVQTTFDEIIIYTDKENRTITVNYKAHGVNIRESKKWSWTQTDKFEYDLENITLINSQKSEPIHENIEISED